MQVTHFMRRLSALQPIQGGSYNIDYRSQPSSNPANPPFSRHSANSALKALAPGA